MGVQINGSEGNVIATKGTFSGDVGIGGTLTYEDVTNIDSVGLITARSGIKVTSGDIAMDTAGNITLGDSGGASDDRLTFGAGTDLSIYHNGTHSIVNNSTGTLILQSDAISLTNNAGNSNRITSHSSGEVKLYYSDSAKLETTSTGTKIIGDLFLDNPDHAGKDIEFDSSLKTLKFDDGVAAKFGTGSDLSIYHDGNNSIITAGNAGDLQLISTFDDIEIKAADNIFIRPQGGEEGIKVMGDGAVELYYDNSKKFNTTSTGTNVVGQVVINETGGTAGKGEIAFGESGRPFIEGFDNGNHGSGAGFNFRSGGGEYFMRMYQDADVELYFNNTKTFETRSDGVKVFGQLVQESSSARAIALNRLGSAGQMVLFDFQGTKCGEILVDTNSTSYITNGSDKTLKKNFQSWDENVLNSFKNINPQKFHFNNQEDTEKKHKGFIAQEMVNSFPEAYPKDDEGKYMFNPTGMVVYLMKSVQELSVENAALKARLDAAGL